MSTFTCDQCWSPIDGVPWCATRRGTYAFLCSPACKESYDNETHRIAWTQGMLDLGQAAFNGGN